MIRIYFIYMCSIEDEYLLLYILEFNNAFTMGKIAMSNKFFHQIINKSRYYQSFKNFFTHNDFAYWSQRNDYYYLFNKACQCNCVEVAKHISYKILLDIHNKNLIFRNSCSRGSFEIIKWLYSLGDIDIHSLDDFAFRIACKEKYLDIAIWLYEKNKEYYNICFPLCRRGLHLFFEAQC